MIVEERELTGTISPTDRVRASISATLERYRDEIDRDGALKGVMVRVRLSEEGEVRSVTVTRDSEFTLQD